MRSRERVVYFTGLCGVLFFFNGCATSSLDRSFKARAKRSPKATAYIDKVPHYPLQQSHGAHASLAMVTHYWDRSRATRKAYKTFKADNDQTNIFQLLDTFMMQSGLWFHITDGTPETLKKRIQNGVPMIVFLQKNALDLSTLRMIVVTGFDHTTRTYLCRDGTQKATTYTFEDFLKEWRSAGHNMLQICPPNKPAWPLSREEYISRGNFYTKHHQTQLAMLDFEKALGTQADDTTLLVDLGNLYREVGNINKAEDLYRKALSTEDPDRRASNNLAFLLAEHTRSLHEAIELAEYAVSTQPENPFSLDTLGYVLYKSKRYDDAADVYEKARQYARGLPKEVQIQIALHQAWNYKKNGDQQFAQQTLLEIIEWGGKSRLPKELLKILSP